MGLFGFGTDRAATFTVESVYLFRHVQNLDVAPANVASAVYFLRSVTMLIHGLPSSPAPGRIRLLSMRFDSGPDGFRICYPHASGRAGDLPTDTINT